MDAEQLRDALTITLAALVERALEGLDQRQLLDLDLCAATGTPPDDWMYEHPTILTLFSEPGVLMAPATRAAVKQAVAARLGGAR
jgi:hypothetical protein